MSNKAAVSKQVLLRCPMRARFVSWGAAIMIGLLQWTLQFLDASAPAFKSLQDVHDKAFRAWKQG